MSLSPSSPASSHCIGNGCDLRLVSRSFRGESRYVCDVCAAVVGEPSCPPAGENGSAESLAAPVEPGQRAGTHRSWGGRRFRSGQSGAAFLPVLTQAQVEQLELMRERPSRHA